MNPHAPHTKAIANLLETVSRRHDRHAVFSDAMECIALAFANVADPRQRDKREARYLEIVKRYERAELLAFAQIREELTEAMEKQPGDVLGALFCESGLSNKYAGQFFTPYELCRLMARIEIGDGEACRQLIRDKGYVGVHEPACGAGAMVIAFAQELRAAGVNYQRQMHVHAIDIDRRAAHMAYIQFTLMHIPALVIVGNAITLEEREHWYTLAHTTGGWSHRLRHARGAEPETMPPASAEAAPAAPDRSGAPPERAQAAQLALF